MVDYFAECGSFKSNCEEDAEEEEEVLGLGFVRCRGGLGRKRIAITTGTVASPSDRKFVAPLKRQRSQIFFPDTEKSHLESLPQDVLIRILCFVDHDDLKQLFLVSKNIREATVIAKQWHFAYATPRKVPAFRNLSDLDSSMEFTGMEPPNAPLRLFSKGGIVKILADVATVLFSEAER